MKIPNDEQMMTTTGVNEPRVFLSYARPDRSQAETLADWLKSNGFNVWWDHELKPGRSFNDEIRMKIETADRVIVLWSESSLNSRYVDAEAMHAWNRNKLLPVIVDDLDPSTIPVPYNTLHTIPIGETNSIRDALTGDTPKPRPNRVSENLVPAALISIILLSALVAVWMMFDRY